MEQKIVGGLVTFKKNSALIRKKSSLLFFSTLFLLAVSVFSSASIVHASAETLTVAKTGLGSVTSSPAGINCGATCSAQFSEFSNVTLTATPSAGYIFRGWSGGGCSGTGTCTVNMTGAQSVTANFVLEVRITKNGTGAGTVAGSGIACGATCYADFAIGSNVEMTATPSAGSTFTGWTNCPSPTGNICRVWNISATHWIDATFTATAAPTYTLTTSISPDGTYGGTMGSGIDCGWGGTICSQSYTGGTNVSLSANPQFGYAFRYFSTSAGISCFSGNSVSPCSFSMPTSAQSIQVVFGAPLTVSKAGTGSGTVTASSINCGADCTEVYAVNQSVVLTATPTGSDTFAGWSGGGCSGTGTCTVTMNTGKTVTATFNAAVTMYTLTAALSGSYGASSVTSSPGGINCGADCSESYASGSNVSLTANPASGYNFTGWVNACPSMPMANPCSVSVTSSKTVTASFAASAVYYTVTASKTGAGASTGTVVSSDSGIDCGTDCFEQYISGGITVLSATAGSGYNFTGWSGGGCSGTGNCVLTVNSGITVTANFDAVPTYTLGVTRSGDYGASVITSSPAGINCGGGGNCSATYSSGTNVLLTASPSSGYSFTGWTNACPSMPLANPCSVSVTSSKIVTASFVEDIVYYGVTVVRGGSYGGSSITSSPGGINCVGVSGDCSESYAYGTNVTLTASPYTGYVFTGWSGGGCSGTGTCTISVNATVTITANFALGYTLTANRAGAGAVTSSVTSSPAGITCGSDCSEFLAYGTNVTLTATGGSGYTFTGWSGGGCSGTGTCTVNINANISVTATFDTLFVFVVTKGGSGSLSSSVVSSPAGINCVGSFTVANCSEPFISGTSVTLTATPGAGYYFSGWSGGGCSGTGTCTKNVNANATTTAAFGTLKTVTVTTNNLSQISVPSVRTTASHVEDVPQDKIKCGNGFDYCVNGFSPLSPVTLKAVPGIGQWFRRWTTSPSGSAWNCDGTSVVNCTFTLSADVSINAEFGNILTVTKVGTVASTSVVTSSPTGVNCPIGCTTQNANFIKDQNVVLTATPAAGYLTVWTGCTSSSGNTCNVTMGAAKSVIATFGPVTYYALAVTKAGPGASVSTVTSSPGGLTCGATCTRNFAEDATVILTAAPAAGYEVVWTGCTAFSGNSCNVVMTGAKNVTATFNNKNLTGSMTGWGWSGTTGWISLNCANLSECGTSNYGLSLNGASLRGYAWGGHIGWIYFPSDQTDGNSVIDLSNCPGSVSLGSACTPPTINSVTGQVTGWARALAGMDSTKANRSRDDGWEGWIELSGTNHPSPGSGVTYDNVGDSLSGYAWGGAVVGWIQFTGASALSNCDFTLSVQKPLVTIVQGGTATNTVNAIVPPGCIANISIDAVQGPSPALLDVKDSQFGSKTLTPSALNATTSTSALSLGSLSTIPYGSYMVSVGGVSSGGTLVPITSGQCVTYHDDAGCTTGTTGGNFMACNSNPVGYYSNTVLYSSCNPLYTTPPNSGANSFTNEANALCGVNNWTSSPATSTYWSINTTRTINCTVPNMVPNISGGGEPVSKVASFTLQVNSLVPECQNGSGWNIAAEANMSQCPDDFTGLTVDTNKSLASVCSNPSGSNPKCQYICKPGYMLNAAGTGCIGAPVVNLKAKPLSGATYNPIVSEPVKLGDPVKIEYTGKNVQFCAGKPGTGDDAIDSAHRWKLPKTMFENPTAQSIYTSVPLTDSTMIASSSCPNSGGAPCYKFTIECRNMLGVVVPTGPNATVKTVEVPLAFGSVLPPTCAPYDNRFASGSPLTTIQIGKPVYWVASTTPDRALDGSRLQFVWSGTDDLDGIIGPGNDGVCGSYWCNWQRFVYKSTGLKEVYVSFSDGGPASWCGPVELTTTINTVFDEF